MTTGLRFVLLGSVEAWRGESQLDLGTPQQRAVLVFLLLREGRAASTEEIADALWGERAPRSARSVVRTYISRLRIVLSASEEGEEVIGSSGSGYAVALEAAYVDVNSFHHLVRRARAARAQGNLAEAVDLFYNALRLWRGTPLSATRGDYIDQERMRLLQHKIAVLEERLELELELGRHVEAGEELADAIAVEPMRERLHELQMISLYRSGRQAEALAVYGRIRQLLAAELGIDPSAGLRDLYQRILRGDPGTAAPARRSAAVVSTWRAPAQLPAAPPGFVGREEEVKAVQEALISTAWAPVVAITGLGGMGKTALAVHAAQMLRDRFPDGQLYADFRAFNDRPGALAAVLVSFLRSFDVREEQVPACLEERVALWRTVLADRRVLIVLDGVIDAEQVCHLLPANPGCAAIVTTWRHMIGLHGVHWVNLDALSPADAMEMLARLVGHRRISQERQAAAELVDLCSHQPLAIRVAANLLQIRPRWTVRQACLHLEEVLYRPEGADDGRVLIEAPLLRAQSRLDPQEATAFRLAALYDHGELTVESGAELLGIPLSGAHRLLETLVDANLLLAGPDGTYRYHRLVKAFARRQAWEREGGERCDAALDRLRRFEGTTMIGQVGRHAAGKSLYARATLEGQALVMVPR
jgi:DNA-binding SARP family transcriptional activator